MKKLGTLFLIFSMIFGFSACSQEEQTSHTTASSQEEQRDIVPITLTIGDAVLDGYLNDSRAAQSLLEQLPMRVVLSDSDNDFCGGNLDLDYSEEDLTSGYENGDLVYWPSANNFVIFVSGQEESQDTDGLVKLGKVTSSQEELDTLEGQIEVQIERKASNDETMQVQITAGNEVMVTEMEDNETTRALIEQMPMTLSMENLYGREMCYRYGAGGLPEGEVRSDGYEVGDIAYWPPRGSLVILYEQDGEQFERVHLGHIDGNLSVFEDGQDVEVLFEVLE